MTGALGGLSGAAFSLSLPPADQSWVAVPALAVLFAIAREGRPRRGAVAGFAFGLVAFGVILSWVSAFGTVAFLPLIVVSAGFVALAGFAANVLWHAAHPYRSALVVASAWTAIEWFRGSWPLGGFTWGMLGSTQLGTPLAHAVPYVGAWGVTFLAAVVAALLSVAVEHLVARDRAERRRAAVVAVAAAALALAPVALPFATADGATLDVATLQVDVRSARPLGPADEDLAVAAAHAVLHRELAPAPPDLIVWGEGALDPAAARDPATLAAVRAVVAEVGVPTLVGAVDRNAAGEEQTSVLLFGADGDRVARYAKTRLVPFGEYVPWRRRLGFIEEIALIPVDRVPGDRAAALRIDGLPAFGTPICFENAFAEVERAMVLDGAEFLVLTINNASYGMSSASRQHLVMSRVRAIETGRWVVHAAISGITAIIDPTGRIVATRGLFEPGITRGTIRTSTRITPAMRVGDLPAALAVAITVLALALPPSRRRTRALSPPLPPTARTLVILPTFNEAGSIGEVLDRLLALPDGVEILVVDDGSPDGTAGIVRRRAAAEPRVRLVERPGKAGLSSAYLLGFRQGLDGEFDLVVEMDSDLSHRPEQLSDILAAARAGADLAIGSRYVPGGGVSNWSRARLALSRAGNAYVRLLLGLPVRDATSGFRAYRRDLLRDLVDRPIRSDGYAFQVELAERSWRLGAEIAEVPITFAERAAGASKMSNRIVAEALLLVTLWGIRSRLGR